MKVLEKIVSRLKALQIETNAYLNSDNLLDSYVDSNISQLKNYKDSTGSTNTKKDGTPSDLFVSGDFHKSIKAYNKRNIIELKSNSPYSESLMGYYGKDILGASKENTTKIHKEIKTKIRKLWQTI